MNSYKKENIQEDLKHLNRAIELRYYEGFYPEMEINELEYYKKVIIPLLLKEDLDAYNYLPEYMKTEDFIERVYCDILSNRTTCDEDKNWIEIGINQEINKCYLERDKKSLKELNDDLYAKQFKSYIPESVLLNPWYKEEEKTR